MRSYFIGYFTFPIGDVGGIGDVVLTLNSEVSGGNKKKSQFFDRYRLLCFILQAFFKGLSFMRAALFKHLFNFLQSFYSTFILLLFPFYLPSTYIFPSFLKTSSLAIVNFQETYSLLHVSCAHTPLTRKLEIFHSLLQPSFKRL